MTAESDPYAVLGVRPDASPSTIASAYRTLARRHHPDVSRASDAERRMAEINAAWTILRDPARRAAWDRNHATDLAASARAWASTGSGRGATDGYRSGHSGAMGGGTAWRRGPNGEGAAGPPPGNPRGSVLTFGRHIGWSLGEIARVDPGYLQWLATHREGGRYRDEIDALLGAIYGRPDPAEHGQEETDQVRLTRQAPGRPAPRPARNDATRSSTSSRTDSRPWPSLG